MPSQATVFPPIALSLLLLLGSGGTVRAITRTRQSTPAGISTQAELLANLAVKLTATENIEQALPLFERAIQAAQAIPDQASKIRALSAIALKLAEIGQTKRSQQLFDQAVQLTSPVKVADWREIGVSEFLGQ